MTSFSDGLQVLVAAIGRYQVEANNPPCGQSLPACQERHFECAQATDLQALVVAQSEVAFKISEAMCFVVLARVHVCQCLRLPHDVAMHVTLAYAECPSSIIAWNFALMLIY